jgi:uncharacterized repeat protein (TIGR03803 family)
MTMTTNMSRNHKNSENRPHRMRRVLPPIILAVFSAALCSSAAQAQTVSVVYSFKKSSLSQRPQFVTPAQGRDGKLNGTTSGSQNGTVFAISAAGSGGQLFALDGTNGSQPFGGVTLATDGNLYGAAEFGGSNGDGVLFQITASGVYAVLHDFVGSGDGLFPAAPPIQASDGNLYGTTLYGPGIIGSTVYSYSSSGGFSTLYTFDAQQGSAILGPLMQASNGNLYGAFQGGGTNNCGGIFELTTSGVLLNDFSFPCGKGPGSPNGPLVQASDGNFYGTTTAGGKKGYGTIFRMNPNGAVTVFYSFLGGSQDGKIPDGGLVQATDGNLYGTTSEGGAHSCGTLYQISTAGVYKLLYSFAQGTGKLESGGLLQHTNGLLYGTAFEGGRQNLGSLYSLDLGLGPFITFVQPTGAVGATAQILGQGLTGTTSVTFNGVAAAGFNVGSDTFVTAVVPIGAATGPVVVTTPGGTLTSNVNFRISE